MAKKDLILREILQTAIKNRQFEFTQKELAEKLKVSLSTVFNALKIPRAQGAIKVTGRNFSIIDLEKMLYIWATQRNMEKEIIYKTNVLSSAKEIEGAMPNDVIFTAYSAYSQKYSDAPADYDKIYIYAAKETLEEIKKRFPKRKGTPNLFILKTDSEMEKFGSITPEAQIFCDLWNLKDWYAKDFLNALKNKIFL